MISLVDFSAGLLYTHDKGNRDSVNYDSVNYRYVYLEFMRYGFFW